MEKHQFTDLDALIDQTHRLFDRWEAEETFALPGHSPALYRLKLAVHEWLANMVQHARFGSDAPCLVVAVRMDHRTLHCIIEDNSDGFDFDALSKNGVELIEAMPERGMGLMILRTCVEDLSYHRCVEEGLNRLELTLSVV